METEIAWSGQGAPRYWIRLVLPGLQPMNTASTRRHAMVQYRMASQLRALVVALVGRRKPWFIPLRRAHLLVTRHSSVMCDRGNLAIAAKPLVDGLVQARVLANDRPEELVTERYEWERAPQGQGYTEVIVVEALENAQATQSALTEGAPP